MKYVCILFLLLAVQAQAQKSSEYDELLVGTHLLSLQWISLEQFGKVKIQKNKGVYIISGEQKKKGGSEFVTIQGTLKPLSKKHLVFEGSITTSLNLWKTKDTCVRNGVFNFVATKDRKYWRLQEMDSPCTPQTDYIDIYFLQ